MSAYLHRIDAVKPPPKPGCLTVLGIDTRVVDVIVIDRS